MLPPGLCIYVSVHLLVSVMLLRTPTSTVALQLPGSELTYTVNMNHKHWFVVVCALPELEEKSSFRMLIVTFCQ